MVKIVAVTNHHTLHKHANIIDACSEHHHTESCLTLEMYWATLGFKSMGSVVATVL